MPLIKNSGFVDETGAISQIFLKMKRNSPPLAFLDGFSFFPTEKKNIHTPLIIPQSINLPPSSHPMDQIEEQLKNLSLDKKSIIEFSSFAGKTLKLNTGADVEPIIQQLQQLMSEHVNEPFHIKLSGNTIGIDAAKELAQTIQSITRLQVCCYVLCVLLTAAQLYIHVYFVHCVFFHTNNHFRPNTTNNDHVLTHTTIEYNTR